MTKKSKNNNNKPLKYFQSTFETTKDADEVEGIRKSMLIFVNMYIHIYTDLYIHTYRQIYVIVCVDKHTCCGWGA